MVEKRLYCVDKFEKLRSSLNSLITAEKPAKFHQDLKIFLEYYTHAFYKNFS